VSADEVTLALRRCLAGDRETSSRALGALVARSGTDRLMEAARRHRVVDAVAIRLRDVPGVDTRTLDELERRAVTKGAHQLRVLEDLGWLAARMDEASVPWLTFKGPVVATLLYDSPDLRSYRDLDLSIGREDFPRAIEALEEAGARLLDANWTLIRREGRGQLHLDLPLGTVADVHWHLLNRRGVRCSFSISMEDVIARARRVRLDGLEVRTLDPVDTLLHLCLHAALGGADRLSWLEDIRRSVAVEEPPWDEVVGRGRAWRAGAPVAVSLRRARSLLGAPVPSWVTDGLDRSRVRRWVGERVDRRWDADAVRPRRGPSALWAQVIRDDARAMAAAAALRMMRPIAYGLHRLTGEPGPDQGSESGAVFKESGSPDERRRFMRAVAAGDL
jgi:hypothetical protein